MGATITRSDTVMDSLSWELAMLRSGHRTDEQRIADLERTVREKDSCIHQLIRARVDDSLTIATQRCQVANLQATLARVRGTPQ
jgi:uncharacterized coiled-coil protein SlyX